VSRRRKEAAIAGAGVRQVVGAELTVESLRRAADQWFTQANGRVRKQVSGGSIVGAVKEQVVGFQKIEGVFGSQRLGDDVRRDLRVEPKSVRVRK
jgi:hypothetical protein